MKLINLENYLSFENIYLADDSPKAVDIKSPFMLWSYIDFDLADSVDCNKATQTILINIYANKLSTARKIYNEAIAELKAKKAGNLDSIDNVARDPQVRLWNIAFRWKF